MDFSVKIDGNEYPVKSHTNNDVEGIHRVA